MRLLSSSRFASVAALLALVVALGGVSYAAVKIPRNSVGSPQIKTNAVKAAEIKSGAVKSPEIRNGAIRKVDLKSGVIPTTPIVGDLPSGKTQQGYGGVIGDANAAGDLENTSVSFPFPIPAALPPAATHWIDFGDPVPAECSGTPADPGADPGNLCIFELVAPLNVANANLNGPGGDGNASRFGFNLWSRATGAGVNVLHVSYAVTAP